MRFVGIDPATKTGFVAMDYDGNVLVELELKGKGRAAKGGITTEQLVDLENQLFRLLQPEDEILIEESAKGTQKGVTTGMIHGGLRTMIFRKKLRYNEINPSQTKKYVGVTGWTGKVGQKERIPKDEKKEVVLQAVYEHFGYSHKSDNIVDAYIMARAALNLYRMREYHLLLDTLPYQIEVTEAILNNA